MLCILHILTYHSSFGVFAILLSRPCYIFLYLCWCLEEYTLGPTDVVYRVFDKFICHSTINFHMLYPHLIYLGTCTQTFLATSKFSFNIYWGWNLARRQSSLEEVVLMGCTCKNFYRRWFWRGHSDAQVNTKQQQRRNRAGEGISQENISWEFSRSSLL